MDSRRISAKSKYKPWIRIGSFGLIVSGALAFLPIPHASYAMRVIVCVVTYLAWDIFLYTGQCAVWHAEFRDLRRP